MQYDKNKIYFKNNDDIIVKNNILNNINVKPAVINNKIKKEYIYAVIVGIFIIILINE